MSRHRNIRTMNVMEEYDGYDDVYGHSVEDGECISPTDANQWIYDRAKGQQSRTEFLANHRNIEEENEEELNHEELHRRDSESYEVPELNPIERAKLMSCMEEIRNIVGDTVSEKQLVETIMHSNYDLASSLDAVLNINKTPPMAEKVVSKAVIEKDLSLSSNIDIPGGFQNLSELANFHLTQNSPNSKAFALPKLFGSPSSGTPPKFTLPKLGIPSTTAALPKINNLSQLANLRLTENDGQSAKFVLPKLFGNEPTTSGGPAALTPLELSLKKIQISEPKPLLSAGIASKNWIVDLTTALVSENDVPIIVRKSDLKTARLVEAFIPRFIDCDIEPIAARISVDCYCELDVTGILKENFQSAKKQPSTFGKVLCRRFGRRTRLRPYVKHEFVRDNEIVPFGFCSLSPDEVALQHLRKGQK